MNIPDDANVSWWVVLRLGPDAKGKPPPSPVWLLDKVKLEARVTFDLWNLGVQTGYSLMVPVNVNAGTDRVDADVVKKIGLGLVKDLKLADFVKSAGLWAHVSPGRAPNVGEDELV